MNSLKFRKVENKIYPSLQLVEEFMVTHEMLMQDIVIIEPLTFGRCVRAIVRNEVRIALYRVCRVLWEIGFLDTPDGVALQFRDDWHWRFWKTRRARQTAKP